MAMQRAAARSSEWAQHFSNASCFEHLKPFLGKKRLLIFFQFLLRTILILALYLINEYTLRRTN